MSASGKANIRRSDTPWEARAERAEAAEAIALVQWNKELKRAMKAEGELTAEREKSERYRLATLKLDAELAAEREKVRVLREALENLRDEQNGPPLEVNRDQWQAAMDEARLALVVTEESK